MTVWFVLAVVLLSLSLFGAGSLLAALATALGRALERFRRRRATVGDILVASDLAEALETFERARGDAQAAIIMWVDADGRLRLLHVGLCALEVGGLLQMALRRES